MSRFFGCKATTRTGRCSKCRCDEFKPHRSGHRTHHCGKCGHVW